MYWGLLACSFVAFAGSTEFIPELNTQLKLVPFTYEFKVTLTSLMVFDYMGCWVVEYVFKALFSDLKAKDIAIRRPEQIEREERRKREAAEKVEQERIKAIEEKRGVANTMPTQKR